MLIYKHMYALYCMCVCINACTYTFMCVYMYIILLHYVCMHALLMSFFALVTVSPCNLINCFELSDELHSTHLQLGTEDRLWPLVQQKLPLVPSESQAHGLLLSL